MSETTILTEVGARGVARITLNRPEVHNAMNEVVIAELTEMLRKLDADPGVRVVVLTGAGKSFCAGGDLGWMRRTADLGYEENVADAMKLGTLLGTLNDMAKPTVALVNGSAYGGGVGMVSCCDIAIASERAKFTLSEVKLGLIPATISPYVVRKISYSAARRYFLTAEIFDAQEARRLGLVHEVVASDDLEAKGQEMLNALALGGPEAQAASKELIFSVHEQPLDRSLIEWTATRIAEARASDEGKEGAQAFLEKRPPAWRPG